MKFFSLIALTLSLIAVAGPAQAASLKKGYAMCRDQTSLERLVAASVKGDHAGFRKLMGGPCRVIGGGERAKITPQGKGLMRLSIKGMRGSWWTVAEAVR